MPVSNPREHVSETMRRLAFYEVVETRKYPDFIRGVEECIILSDSRTKDSHIERCI